MQTEVEVRTACVPSTRAYPPQTICDQRVMNGETGRGWIGAVVSART